MHSRWSWLVGACLLLAFATPACGNSGGDGLGDGGADGDADADTDADADSDSDSDSDADTDSDTDADSDGDGGADGDSDADADGDGGASIGTCADMDSDGWCVPLDCDDLNAAVYPGATEVPAGGLDDDCDGVTDETPWQAIDRDSDGYSPLDGDCDDYSEFVNPSAIEDLGDGSGDGVDNDCDGSIDEDDSCTCAATGTGIPALVCAMDICIDDWLGLFYTSGSLSSPNGVTLSKMTNTATAAVDRFGSTSNALAPMKGSSYALLSSGNASQTSGARGTLLGATEWTDPWDTAHHTHDVVEIVVNLKAPSNALGFSFDYVFFSAEYDDYIGTAYNDKFYAIMNGSSTGNVDKIINFTNCRDQSSGGYVDFVDTGACSTHPYGHCCYIAINNSYSECCWYGGCTGGVSDFDITGTGFECAASSGTDSSAKGSSTEWLRTTASVSPGETFSLRFHIHDTQDQVFDSEVILDDFKWYTQPVEPGTSPVE
jgi:hypothetical protein